MLNKGILSDLSYLNEKYVNGPPADVVVSRYYVLYGSILKFFNPLFQFATLI